MPGMVSAGGLVGFLSEPDPSLQIFALRAANQNIGLLWTELAGAVGQIEALYEDESFPERNLAALVASKIYYHLQEYDESMVFALGAGELFDIEHEGEFEDTIIAKCIDTYIALSASQSTLDIKEGTAQSTDELHHVFSNGVNGSASTSAAHTSTTTPFSQSALPSKSLLSREDSTIDASADGILTGAGPVSASALPPKTQQALNSVIRRLFERCFQEGAYRHVVGIAVEAKNLDILRESIERAGGEGGKGKGKDKSGKREDLMDYLLDICLNVIQERVFRNEILRLILDLLLANKISSPDYFSIARCMVYLDQHAMAADILQQLVDKDDAHSLSVAYQISFDLYDNGTQDFLAKVIEALPETGEEKSEFSTMPNGSDETQTSTTEGDSASEQLLSELANSSGPPTTSTVTSRPKTLSDAHKKAFTSIREILEGSKSIELGLEFLFRTSKTDKAVLTKLKGSLEARNSIFHSAVTFANAFMNAGTTGDFFIRENLDWLGKAVNWSKFTVTASLGVIHRGNIGQGQKLLEPYLREGASGSASSAYTRGGALYALGLIYTNHGKHVVDYLHKQLKDGASEEVIQHGACLGVGVAGMGTESKEVVEELKNALFTDSAISGQAAGIGIGLVLVGSGDTKNISDMITYAHETEHDKTVRGLALGIALIMYGRQEGADELINGLLDDPNPTLRYGGIWAIALAYCGTSSNKAVRKLLHVAVSDVNDDVRRTAVMGLGFVLFRKPGSVPRMVELLAESYNPHVRYGAAMALGIACAGTGLEEAVDLLEPMMKDTTDFVRQGALIALSMIMVQQSEAMNPKTVTFRKHLQKVVADRHEDAMAKFGAALAMGIIDAGGRNCTIGLQTQSGNLNMSAIVGMAIFTQYWYWFPLTHFISLSFTPTGIIGVDQDLELPEFKLHCNARPSMFEYPPAMEVKTEEAPEKVKTAILSTTVQARRRKAAKERQQRGESMDIDIPPTTPKALAETEDKMELEDDQAKDTEEKKDSEAAPGKSIKAKLEKEKVGFELDNMSRVLPAQLRYISFPEGRYVPIKKPTGGVVLLTDTKPSEEKSLLERQVKKAQPKAAPDTTAPQTPTPGSRSRGLDGLNALADAASAATAASVLSAVDEDDEGGEEAELPEEFDYHSDPEDAEE